MAISVESSIPPNGAITPAEAVVKVYGSSTDADDDTNEIATATTHTTGQPIRFTPAVIGYNYDLIDTSAIFVKVTNNGADTANITVKLTVLQLEA